MSMKTHKPTTLFLAIFCTAVQLTGCTDSVGIEGKDWMLSIVQGGTDGSVTACAPEYEDVCPDAKVVRVTCTAEDGVLTVTDQDSGKRQTASYRVLKRTKKGAIYMLSYGGGKTEYPASVGITTYPDKAPAYTLNIAGEKVSLTFTAEKG